MRTIDQKPSIIFFGTDEFAAIILKALKDADFNVVTEITKSLSSQKLTKLMQLGKLKADLGVVASYGKIIPKKILDSFPHGMLNVHPSLLPKYRGPSPIRTAIASGDAETGVTIMKMDEELDHGPILAQTKVPMTTILPYGKIVDILAKTGAELLIKTIPDYIDGKIAPQEQDHAQATYTKLLTRDDGKVDLEKDAPQNIYNKFRAYEGWPGIFTYHETRIMKHSIRVKILNCKLKDGKLKILEVQPEGKKPMSVQAFINGYGPLPHP